MILQLLKLKGFMPPKLIILLAELQHSWKTDLLHKLNLHDEKDKPIKSNNAVCSVMRGISISDSEYMTETVPTAILQKVDYSLINGKVKGPSITDFPRMYFTVGAVCISVQAGYKR